MIKFMLKHVSDAYYKNTKHVQTTSNFLSKYVGKRKHFPECTIIDINLTLENIVM